MRRVLTTLMILLVVLVAGLSALVVMVNPNDFRDYMVRQVEARSGYQLKLDGPLRWHVWPQLSILSGRVTLTAPGAEVPVVKADNMRLDVGLLPLLSHQLQVKQVMLKGAVIQLTPQTYAAPEHDAPVAPKENILPQAAEDRGWSWDIARLQVADSVLVFQHENDEQITVRDIRLQMEQDAAHQATLDFSGRVNRDQRDLSLSLKAQVDASDYPSHLTATISDLKWLLQGGDVPAQGITGAGSLSAQWQGNRQQISLSDLHLSANDSAFSGKGSVILSEKPQWLLDLQFDTLNLDNLLAPKETASTDASTDQQGQQAQARMPRPVIANNIEPEYTSLRDFTAQVSLTANNIRWRGMRFDNVKGQFSNNAGLLNISTLQGKMGDGDISLPGMLDVRRDNSRAVFQPRLDNVEIGTILKAFNYPIALTGKLSLAGDFSGSRIDADDFRRHWQGEAPLFTDAIEAEIIELAEQRSDEGKQWFGRVMGIIGKGRKSDGEQFSQVRDAVENVAQSHADLLDSFNDLSRAREQDSQAIQKLTSDLAALTSKLVSTDANFSQREPASGGANAQLADY